MASAAFAVDCNWTGNGFTPNWTDSGNWQNGTVPQSNQDNAIFPNVGAPISVTVDVNITNRTVYFRNPQGTTMTVASGVNLFFSNGGGLTLRAEEDAVINGDGTIEFSTGGGENYADQQAYPGKTLTLDVKVTGDYGFEHNGTGGNIVLTNPNNDYKLSTYYTAAGWLTVSSVADTGVPCAIGAGNEVKFNNGEFRYVGAGDSTDRRFIQNAGGGADRIIEHAGTGTLAFTGPIFSGNDSAHAFIFNIVDPSAVIDIAGSYYNGGTAAMGLHKRGLGTLRVSAATTYTGTTVIEQGTVEVASGGSFSTGSLVSMRGGTLLFNKTGASSIGKLEVNTGVSSLVIDPGISSATLTLASLANVFGFIDFSAADLGGGTKIFISGQSDGLIGPWATVNGGAVLAEYDSVAGVRAATLTLQNIAALGTSVILDAPASEARILTDTIDDGGITLEKDPTRIAMLSQEVGTPAVVSFNGYTLVTPLVQITLGGADLTLGDAYGDGVLFSNNDAANILYLANANAAGVSKLTVKAAVTDNGGSKTRVAKSGPGDVALAGPITHTGGTMVDAGVLTVANDTDMTWPDGGISGNGGFGKAGDGTLFMPNIANTYNGTTIVSRGTVSILHSQTFGSAAAPTVVKKGGAIDLIGTGAQSLQLNTEEIFAEGAGPDNLGALRNTGPNSQYNAIRFLTLTDDLTVYAQGQRFDVRNSGGNAYLNFNGHGIIKKGTNMFGLTNVAATNDQGTAFIDIQEGSVTLEVGSTLSGGTNNVMTLRGGTYFDFYNISSPINWSLVMEDNARIHTRNGLGSTVNIWTGPVALGGTATFTTDGANNIWSDTFTGDISGVGPLIKTASNDRCVTYLRGTNNTWTGGTQIQNGVLYAADKGSLPDYDTDVEVSGRGTLAVRVADALGTQSGFPLSEIESIINNGTTFLSTTASIGFDTAYENLDYTDPFPHIGIRKFGPNTLTLSSPGADLGPIAVYGGTLEFQKHSSYTGEENVSIGFSTSAAEPLAILDLNGTAEITPLDRGHQVSGQPQLIVGDTGRGVLRVSDDAKISGRLIVGNAANSAGAVYQTGGTVHNTGGHSSDAYIGATGYAYYLLADGVFTNNGYTQVGRNPTGYGIVHQTGGTLAFSSVYSGPFSLSRGGQGVIRQEGGVFRHRGTFPIGENSGDNSGNNGYAEFTSIGKAQAFISGAIEMANRGSMTALLNLNGGEVEANRIWRAGRTNEFGEVIHFSNAYVNWNGGRFRAINAEAALFNGQFAGLYPDVTLYSGGAVIDIPDMGKNKTVDTPLKAPQDFGITSIPVATGGSGYLGSPFVSISGSGWGASAFAHVDLDNGGVLTHIEITSPGQGFTSSPTVTLIGGGPAIAATLATATIGPVPSGGLLKLGNGKLTLNATNTYTGTTEVREGLLELAGTAVLSPHSEVAVTGGMLDLGGGTLSNGSLTVTAGSVLNGYIAGGLDKSGPGMFTLSTPLSYGPPRPQPRTLVPGLREGLIRENWNHWTPCPKEGIQRTTRAGNGGVQAGNGGFAGGIWSGGNRTWCYSGYIWNNSDEDVTWTFFGRFNNNMMLLIDGKTILRTVNSADAFATYTLTPGPHPFEARFGVDTGEVGPGPNNRPVRPANGPMSGLLVNYSGLTGTTQELTDALDTFEILEDPGDGSLFTLALPEPELPGPGLAESVIQSAWRTTDDGVFVSRQLTTRAGNGSPHTSNATHAGGLWMNGNHTWIYKGYLWNREETPVTWRWRLLFDDYVLLKINGQLVAEALTNKQDPTYANVTLNPGPNAIEIRFGDGGGSVGAHSGLGGLTYTDDPLKLDSTTAGDFILLVDPGDGSLLTTSPDWTPPGEGEGEEEQEELDYPVVNVTDGTLRLMLSSSAGLLEGFIPGNIGMGPNPGDCIELTTTAANGGINTDQFNSRVPINGKVWEAQSTYVYTGYIWNRTGGDVTWTFAENFDDKCLLIIDKTPYTTDWDDPETVLHDETWDRPTIGTITLSPGPHKFEVRFSQGTGGVAGNVSGWWNNGQMSFGIDFEGRTGTAASNLTNYVLLQDPGNGMLLTWTLDEQLGKDELLGTAQVNLGDTGVLDLGDNTHKVGVIAGTGTVISGTLASGSVISPAGDDAIGTLAFDGVTFAQGVIYRLTTDGSESDCITSTGTLDLSGLTIVPAPGTIPTAPSYIIAHADGGFIGKPALDGFPTKYKIMRRGNDLLLTSFGGTVMILR